MSTERFDGQLAQFLCYAGSLLVLVLGMLKLCRLGLDEAHLFFGVLLVLCLTFLGIIGGTLAGPTEKAV
jgi:hypothetical protein